MEVIMNNKTLRTLVVVVALVVMIPLFAGCGTKLTQANFDKIEASQTTYDQAKQILGNPTVGISGGSEVLKAGTAIWRDGKRAINLVFLNDVVTVKTSKGLK